MNLDPIYFISAADSMHEFEQAVNSTSELLCLPHELAVTIRDVSDLRIALLTTDALDNAVIAAELETCIETGYETKAGIQDFNFDLLNALNEIAVATGEFRGDLEATPGNGSLPLHISLYLPRSLYLQSFYLPPERIWIAYSVHRTAHTLHAIAGSIRNVLQRLSGLIGNVKVMTASIKSASPGVNK